MSLFPPTPDVWEILGALFISFISGTISILRRISQGTGGNIFWIISEFLTAILCGYLMYHAYPVIDPMVADFFTLPVAVALAAYSGGRIFQEIEQLLLEHYQLLKSQRGSK